MEVKGRYVNIKHVEELIRLIDVRDSFNFWSDEYGKYDRKIERTIEWLKRNAKEINGGGKDE